MPFSFRGTYRSRDSARVSLDLTIAMCCPALISENSTIVRADPGQARGVVQPTTGFAPQSRHFPCVPGAPIADGIGDAAAVRRKDRTHFGQVVVRQRDRLAVGKELHVQLTRRHERAGSTNERKHATVWRQRGLGDRVQIRELYPVGPACHRPSIEPRPDVGASRDHENRSGADRNPRPSRYRTGRQQPFTDSTRLVDGLQSASAVFLQTLPQQLVNRRWRRSRQQAPVWFLFENLADGIRGGIGGEYLPARQHLEEDTAERPDIGPRVDVLPASLLGTHVRRSPEDDTDSRVASRSR